MLSTYGLSSDKIVGLRALVCDDNPLVRHYLIQWLQAKKWSIQECDSLMLLKKILAESEFDLLFLDLILKDEVSWTWLKENYDRIRTRTKVVVISHLHPEDVFAISSIGETFWDYFLVKPLNLDQLSFLLDESQWPKNQKGGA